MTTGKTKALTGWTFVGKVMSQLFNMLPRLVIAFLPRNKRLLISWLHSPSAVIWEPPKIKSVTVSIVSPTICHEVIGPDAMILVFWMLSFKPTFSMQCWRPWFNLWVGKIPWKREWQSTPGSFPGESHGQRSLAGFSPWGHKESDMTERLTHSRYLITYWMLPIFPSLNSQERIWWVKFSFATMSHHNPWIHCPGTRSLSLVLLAMVQ